jgi:predicted ArsR family transcriptional regulator
LLYSIFKKKTAALKAKAKGDTVADRAKWLAHVRDGEGYMAAFITDEKDGGPQILECPSPLLNVLEQYPIMGRFEQEMFEAVLGTRVRREVSRNSGLYECAFYFLRN